MQTEDGSKHPHLIGSAKLHQIYYNLYAAFTASSDTLSNQYIWICEIKSMSE